MTDWTDPNGFQVEALRDAILFAYPRQSELEMTLNLRLGKRWAEVVPAGETYRVGVFELLSAARAEGWLPQMIDMVRKHKPKSPKLVQLERTLGLTSAPIPGGGALEDIVRNEGGFHNLLDWVGRLEGLAWRICRIECPVNQARGTGWLVRPDLILTNWHVVRRALSGELDAKEIACRFDYAVDAGVTREGTLVRLAPGEAWCVDWSSASEAEQGKVAANGDGAASAETLDYALLRLEAPVGDLNRADGVARGWIDVKKGPPAPRPGSIAFVLQHPDGNPIKLAAGAIRGETEAGFRLLHDVNTLPGSSGSPVLDAHLEPIALHHAGDPLYDGETGSPRQNQAVPLAPILDRLARRGKPQIWKD